ncbi:MAG: diphthine synthase [Candidatus Thermoplasmatota archaeon]|nr:diphthine synthase [Candidatus Thermoplasmatota archaeon]
MGEILFVGVGLYDEKGLSLRALEELRGASTVFIEQYTAVLAPGTVQRLSELIGHPILELPRSAVEEERPILEALERKGKVALLIPGEPFAATTHLSLRITVEQKGHTWRVLHGASILTAAASLAGLFHYKFGRVVSLPYPSSEGSYRPISPYRHIQANWQAGLHTLILLDLDPSLERFLTAEVALRHLGQLEEELHGGVAPPEREYCVVARAGAPDARVWVGPRIELETREFGPPLHCLLLPAPPLHFMEEEALGLWKRSVTGVP